MFHALSCLFILTAFVSLSPLAVGGEDKVYAGDDGSKQETHSSMLRPIIYDRSKCPNGWDAAEYQCVQLQYSPARYDQAQTDCQQIGGELVQIYRRENEGARAEPDQALIEDLSVLIDKAIGSGVNELSWLVGFEQVPVPTNRRPLFAPQTQQNITQRQFLPKRLPTDSRSVSAEAVRLPKRLRRGGRLHIANDDREEIIKPVVLQKRVGTLTFDIVHVSPHSLYPFICAILPGWRQQLTYEQSQLPTPGKIPRIMEGPEPSYHFDVMTSEFVVLPCFASGVPNPEIQWFRNGAEKVDVNSLGSQYLLSGGSLLIKTSAGNNFSSNALTTSSIDSYYCTASNQFGTVRSATTVVRPAFVDSFVESRLDAYPLQGGGSRLECNAPRHFPKSYSFAWARGGRGSGKFVEISARTFVSMDGTLYYSYNLKEDEDSYACTLSQVAMKSAQHGPFFQLVLPSAIYLPKFSAKMMSTSNNDGLQSFPPRIDEYQPQVFPEIPIRGQTVTIECFGYGFPSPSYKWSRADDLPLNSRRHRLMNYGRVLRIENVQLEDAGRYRCSILNDLGQDSAEVQLIIQVPPTVLRPLISRLLAPGSSTNFECSISDSNGRCTNVEWFRNGLPLVPLLMSSNDRKRFKVAGSELIITNLAPSDSAMYECMVGNDLGSAATSALLLVAEFAPRFHSNMFPTRLFIAQGTRLNLPCIYMASPRGEARWHRRLGAKISTEKAQMKTRKVSMGIPNQELALIELEAAQISDSGDYECVATNKLGEARATVTITVFVKPTISIRKEAVVDGSSVAALPGSRYICEAELECLSTECPESTSFKWEFNGKPSRTSEVVRENDSDQATRFHSGFDVSDDFARKNPGRISCHSLFGDAVAELEAPESWLSRLTPTHLNVRDIEANSLRLIWKMHKIASDKIYNFSQKIKTYLIEARTDEERHWRTFGEKSLLKSENEKDLSTEDFIIQGLEPNRKYQFRVRIQTENGQIGPPSPSTAWVRTLRSVPFASVQNLRFRMLDNLHLLLEWNPVEIEHKSGSNLHYNVSWKIFDKDMNRIQNTLEAVDVETKASITSWESVQSSRAVISLPKLHEKFQKNSEKCIVMDVGIRPWNDIGPGKFGAQQTIFIAKHGPKRRAVDLRLSAVNSTHLKLSWSWSGTGQCENVHGAKIECEEESNGTLLKNKNEVVLSSEEDTSTEFEGDPNFYVVNKRHISNAMKGSKKIVQQSVPSHYTSWLVKGFRPLTKYRCKVNAFDQFGREGPDSSNAEDPLSIYARARTTMPPPKHAPQIVKVRLLEMADGGAAVIVDWSAVRLVSDGRDSISTLESESHKRSKHNATGPSDTSKGYKIFIYVSETAEKSLELRLAEGELHHPERPSARLDGLKPMLFYRIQIAAFNAGGTGPLSDPIPVRISSNHIYDKQQMASSRSAFSSRVVSLHREKFGQMFLLSNLVLLYSFHLFLKILYF